MRTNRDLKTHLGVVAFVGAAATACASPESFESTEAEVHGAPLYALSTSIWPSNDISVCWETTGSQTQKGWVQSAVAGTWQQQSGVSFTGWGDCGSGTANLRIKISDEVPHLRDPLVFRV